MAGDVTFEVDFDTKKARAGIDAVGGEIDKAGKKTKSLGLAMGVMFGNIASQAAMAAATMAKNLIVSSAKSGIELEKSTALLARRTMVSKEESAKLIRETADEFGVSAVDAANVLLDSSREQKNTLQGVVEQSKSAFITASALGESVAPVAEGIRAFAKKFNVDNEAAASAVFDIVESGAMEADRIKGFVEGIRGTKSTFEQIQNIIAGAKEKGVGGEQLKTLLGPLLGAGPENMMLKRMKKNLQSIGAEKSKTTFKEVEIASNRMRSLGGTTAKEAVAGIKTSVSSMVEKELRTASSTIDKMNAEAIVVQDAQGKTRKIRQFGAAPQPSDGETVIDRGWNVRASEMAGGESAIDRGVNVRTTVAERQEPIQPMPDPASGAPGKNIYGASADDPYGKKAKAAADEANRLRRAQLSEQKATRQASEK